MTHQPACRICKNSGGTTFFAAERMMGLDGRFEYLCCARCGSVSLKELPANMGIYYPAAGYYSFSKSEVEQKRKPLRDSVFDLQKWLSGVRTMDVDQVRKLVPFTARILDVGSGAGAKLDKLWAAGYRHLCGVDPFLPPNLARETPYPLVRGGVDSAGQGWDLVMYHHVLEHVSDPVTELAHASRALKDDGLLLVRVPVADSWAFEHYREHWVQLDAPRHLCLFTRKALIAVAAQHQLELVKLFDDSTAFQIWASRMYRDSTATLDSANTGSRLRRMIRWFPEFLYTAAFAECLNMSKRGDQSCFVFRKNVAGMTEAETNCIGRS